MKDTNGTKKALAAAGFALGLTSSGSVAGDAVEQRQQTQPQTGLQALVFVTDYQPGVGFQMVSRVQQPTVNQILGYVDPANPNQSDGAVVDPTDWNGYIINYTGCGPGNYNLIFLREGTLQQGTTYSFTTNAVYFSDRLQLLESQIRRGTGEAAGRAGEETTVEGAGETQAETPQETATTEGTTTTPQGTATTEETTTTTTEGTATTPSDATPPDATTTADGTPTTEQVIVNATETDDGG